MDKVRFYRLLDIDSADEFKYYENLSALLEEDEYIEENLIKDLISHADREKLAEKRQLNRIAQHINAILNLQ